MYYFENINNVRILKRLSSLNNRKLYGYENICDGDDEYINQVLSYYVNTLKTEQRATDYLSSRGLYYLRAIDHFSLGFADRSLGLKLHKLDKAQEELVRGSLQRSGLLKSTGHEFFSGAILFPFTDEEGKVTGGYGRRVTPKLRAPSVYHLHWVSDNTTFFNLPALAQNKEIILCKSPLEALTLWCLGFKNVVATMGYLSFTDQHLKKLKQYEIQTVLLAYGKTTTAKKKVAFIKQKLIKEHILSYELFLPDGMDVNQYVTSAVEPVKLVRNLIDCTLNCTGIKGGLS